MKFKLKQILKMTMQHIILPVVYNANRWRKIDSDLVILADAHRSYCPESMRRIRDELKKSNFNIKEYFFDVDALSPWEVFLKMAGFMRLYAQSPVVFISDYFLPVVSCRKRKGTKVVQLWHGAGAFKKFGYDCPEDIPERYKGYMFKNYDMVTVSGKACVPYFSSAMRVDTSHTTVAPVGMSLTDRYYDSEYKQEIKDRFRYEFPDAWGKKVILYAPTFRGNAGDARNCEDTIIDGIAEYYNNKSEIFIIKSNHPHIKGKNRSMTTSELMLCADLLITDYSSVFFEFLLLDRPIIFYAPDFEEYSRNRGFYLDYTKLPGRVITGNISEHELAACIEACLENDDKIEERKLFARDYMDGCDGRATERILDYVKGNLVV